MKIRFFIIRHGESLGNLNKICLGHTDLGLTDRGHEQASLTADALKDIPFLRIYSSDLVRAVETALPNASLRGLGAADIISRTDLRELYFGDWENAAVAFLEAEYREMFTVGWRQGFGTFTPPNGESVPALANRICNALAEVARECALDARCKVLSEGCFGGAKVLSDGSFNSPEDLSNVCSNNAKGLSDGSSARVKDCAKEDVATNAKNRCRADFTGESCAEKDGEVNAGMPCKADYIGECSTAKDVEINVLVVSHAASIRAFWGKISGYRADEVCAAVPFPSNASYSVVDYDLESEAFTPISYSVDGHLSELKTALPG
ncbi:MAG: histidine phosphatase family protein [Clostridia bacterium]|nr:histidine phosphatase family protein [Clostridia bacterium]